MSSDYRPSFRAALKGKINRVIKNNVTSSIRERIISNDTYHHMREKTRNLTDTVIDRTHMGSIINKTKGYLPGVFRKDNETVSKGFYDSLFSPQSTEDVYLKVAVISLWVIAILCIIPTIITIFIPVRKKEIKTTGVKMIFFHIFLCELFYLIYIFLSMINVAQSYKLNSVVCDFANHGMYITIPVMYLALFFLSIERITKRCSAAGGGWMKIFTEAWITQLILIFIWVILITIIVTVMFIKKQFSTLNVLKRAKDIIPSNFGGALETFVPPYRCTIDGRLSPVFKILFIILFVVLIVLIIKSMAISLAYKCPMSACCGGTGNNDTTDLANRHITLLFAIFLFLNLFLSFPFYGVSMADSILRHFISSKDKFTSKLKICFILRITSIILQCLIYYTFESKSWHFLRLLIYQATCKKFPIFNDGVAPEKRTTTRESESSKMKIKWEKNKIGSNKRPVNGKQTTANISSKNTEKLLTTDSDNVDSDDERKATATTKDRKENRSNNKTNETIGRLATKDISVASSDPESEVENPSTDEGNDDVFIKDTNNKIQTMKKSLRTVEKVSDEDDSDDETKTKQKPKLSPTKTESTTNSRQKKDDDEERVPLKTQTSNGKSVSHRISSTTKNLKTSKTNSEQNKTKHHSTSSSSSSSSSSSDESSNHSDDNTKPTPRISAGEQKRTKTELTNGNSSQHRTKPSQSNNHRRKKPKQDCISKMNENSDPV